VHEPDPPTRTVPDTELDRAVQHADPALALVLLLARDAALRIRATLRRRVLAATQPASPGAQACGRVSPCSAFGLRVGAPPAAVARPPLPSRCALGPPPR
jgi:hypothetical protein